MRRGPSSARQITGGFRKLDPFRHKRNPPTTRIRTGNCRHTRLPGQAGRRTAQPAVENLQRFGRPTHNFSAALPAPVSVIPFLQANWKSPFPVCLPVFSPVRTCIHSLNRLSDGKRTVIGRIDIFKRRLVKKKSEKTLDLKSTSSCKMNYIREVRPGLWS